MQMKIMRNHFMLAGMSIIKIDNGMCQGGHGYIATLIPCWW